jgi:hypothetical protein
MIANPVETWRIHKHELERPIGVGGLLLMAGVHAKAAALPNSTSELELSLYDLGAISSSSPGTIGETRTFGRGSATITQGLDPYVAASASGSCSLNTGGDQTSAEYDYSFQITGTSGSVPMIISARGETAINGGNAVVDFTVSGNGTYVVNTLGVTSFSLDKAVNLAANTEYNVEIESIVSAVYGLDSASASVDPQISIDPTYAAANPGVSLCFQPGFLACA